MQESFSLSKENIVANEKLCAKIYKSIKSNNTSHAYIIEGSKGSGRHTIARNIIAAMACQGDGKILPCNSCKHCKEIFNETCPDIMVIGKEGKASVGVEAVRNIKNTLSTIPNDLDFKVYIIEDADTMTLQAQNAFLLSLEEPPRFVKFFLICENSRSLLETIRSRAPVLRTEPISIEKISEYLCSNKPPKEISVAAKSLKENNKEEFDTILLSCNGSIGRAQDLLSPKLRKPIDDCRALSLKFINLLNSSVNLDSVLTMIPDFSQKRDELSTQLEYIKTALRDLILLKKTEKAPLCFFTDREKALDISCTFHEKKLIAIYEIVDNAVDALQKNANVRLTLINMLTNL